MSLAGHVFRWTSESSLIILIHAHEGFQAEVPLIGFKLPASRPYQEGQLITGGGWSQRCHLAGSGEVMA